MMQEDKAMKKEDLQRLQEMRLKLRSMGASDEDILTLWKAALQTADKIIENG